jgi:hypothetical protein
MKMQTINIKIQNTTEVKHERKFLTLGCQRSYCECNVFPIFSRALGGAIENGSEKKETKIYEQISRQLTREITVFKYKTINQYEFPCLKSSK